MKGRAVGKIELISLVLQRGARTLKCPSVFIQMDEKVKSCT